MPLRPTHIAVLMLFLAGSLSAGTGYAQLSGEKPAVFEGVGMQEQLGTFVPKTLRFTDEQGREVSLGSYLGGEKPVLLTMVYHNCPMLCNLLLDAVNETLRRMEWVPGQEFEVVTVSFAPDEGPELAARQKEKYVKALGKPAAAAGWHFLTGSEASIQALARAVGFQYRWVEAQQEYAHPAALIFLSGEGKISRYLYGFEYAPRDVRTALVEASEGRVGNALDQVVLFCFQYDPQKNSYVPHAMNLMKLGGTLTMLALGTLLFIFWRRERQSLNEAQGLNEVQAAS